MMLSPTELDEVMNLCARAVGKCSPGLWGAHPREEQARTVGDSHLSPPMGLSCCVTCVVTAPMFQLLEIRAVTV